MKRDLVILRKKGFNVAEENIIRCRRPLYVNGKPPPRFIKTVYFDTITKRSTSPKVCYFCNLPLTDATRYSNSLLEVTRDEFGNIIKDSDYKIGFFCKNHRGKADHTVVDTTVVNLYSESTIAD